MRASAFVIVMALGLVSCSKANPATGAVVRIDAEASIAADTTSLVVRVYGSDGVQANGGDVLREERTVPLGTTFHLPYTIGITPLGGDVTRLYRIEVEARDGMGKLIAVAKAISGYMSGRVLLVDLVFTDACRGVVCSDASQTCKLAACADANVDPTMLPVFHADAGPSQCDAGFYSLDAGACVDVDECLTANGGCDPLTTCTNTAGGRTCGACPTGYTGDGLAGCVDVDECLTANGGCDPLTTCTNTAGGRTCGACPTGYTGDGLTGCVDVDECLTANGGCVAPTVCDNTPGGYSCDAAPSCKALFDAGVTVSGPYMIDPDGAGSLASFQVYCDMTGAGGGWTLIRSSTSGGTDGSVEGLPTPATNLHLSPARMIALAAISQQVHIRTSGNPSDAITSNAGSQPILGMRAGGPMYDANVTGCDYGPAADWTGPAAHLTNLYYSCCPQVGPYPNGVFHSCNFGSGLSWFRTYNGWTFGAANNLEMYFR